MSIKTQTEVEQEQAKEREKKAIRDGYESYGDFLLHLKVMLNRLENDFKHHPPSISSIAVHDNIRTSCHDLAQHLVHTCPRGRELSTALTKVEEAMFWANAAVARIRK